MNNSGIKPIGHRVIVLPEQISETAGSGIIAKPKSTIESEELAQVEGVIVAQGAEAFSYGKVKDGSIDYWGGDLPCPGERVLFSKYSGLMRDGADGKRYRVINDTDVIGIIEGESDERS